MMTIRAPPYMSAIGGPDLAHPHHVEQDVQRRRRAASQRSGSSTSGRSRTPDTRRWRRTSASVRPPGPRIEKIAPENMLAASRTVTSRRRGIEGRAAVDDQRDEPEVVAEPPQHRAEAPETRDCAGRTCNTCRR